MSTRFVLLSTQRTGSTWVIDSLNSHPAVRAYGELFLQDGKGTPPWGGRNVAFFDTYVASKPPFMRRRLRLALILRYLSRLYAKQHGLQAIGFKLMYGQAGAYPALFPYFVARRVAVIHLIRRNVLDVVLSREVAVARDLFHARQGDDVAPVRVRIDAPNVLNRLAKEERQVERARKRFHRFGLPYLEIYYEDLLSGVTSFDDVLHFLGVDNRNMKLSSPLKKLNVAPYSELIENFDDVRAVLVGSRFEPLLHQQARPADSTGISMLASSEQPLKSRQGE